MRTSNVETLITVAEVARRLWVSTRTVSRLAHRGELTPVKIGRSTRFRVEDVERFIQKGGCR